MKAINRKFGKKRTKAVVLIATILLAMGIIIPAPAATLAAPVGMTQAQRDFIARIGPQVSEDMRRGGVLASLSLAQAILESNWGTSQLAVKANALFGIKADGRWNGRTYSISTREHTGAGVITVTAKFRAYGSWEQSIADHAAFLAASSRYAAVIGERDYKKACVAIHKAGYATDPGYADKLVRLIETYGLAAYDDPMDPYDSADAPEPDAAYDAVGAPATYTASRRHTLWRIAARMLRKGG
jgi:flagellum-specific peptidoglycan hydrolase FlgJ